MSDTKTNQWLHCPLCGYEFEKCDTPCEHGCPLGRYCNLVCCPNCRYEFPPEPTMFTWLKGLFRRPPATAPLQPGMRSLFFLNEGDQGELVCLNCTHTSRATALAVYGLVPGSRLILQQKRPSFVVRVGETELALDADIAKEIIVKRVTDLVGAADDQPE